MDRSTKWTTKPTEKGHIVLEEKLEAIARRYRNNSTKKPKGVSAPTGGIPHHPKSGHMTTTRKAKNIARRWHDRNSQPLVQMTQILGS